VSAASQLIAAIDGIRRVEGEANLLGHSYVLGILHHAWLVRVVESAG
jgi:hypothetical protein